MPEITLRLAGLDRVNERLNRMAQGIGLEFGYAMRMEAEIEMTEAKKRTPVLTGALRASGHVTGPTWSGRNLTVELKFGGPAAPYAVAVHENEEVFHRVGQAKFLESVLYESAPHLAQRIAARASNFVLGIS